MINKFKRLSLLCSIAIIGYLFSTCSNNKYSVDEKLHQTAHIDSLQHKMQAERNKALNKELASQVIAAYKEYVKSFPEDTTCAEYLFRTSDLARGVGDYTTALNSLQTIISQYSSFAKMPECFFLRGYYCQEFFNDTTNAKKYYKEFISKYPQHPLANDAKALIGMFGKTDDEIVEGFRSKKP